VSRCPYCDFVVYAGAAARGPRNRIRRYRAALMSELRLRAAGLDKSFGPPGTPERASLTSLYIGGGTPSLLGPEAVASIVALARDRFGLSPDAEITLEINPGPDERGVAAAWREAGVTRLSIGAQSMVDAEIRQLGRRHAAADVIDTVEEARAARIESVAIDLLYDIPGQRLDTWGISLDSALALAPDHLSLYALTLDDPTAEGLTGTGGDHLPVTPGALRWRQRARPAQDEDRAAAMYELAVDRLAADGWIGYEISNWARPGHESRHNLAYWERLPYEAVGPGAHAFDGATRRWNGAALDAWLDALDPPPPASPRLPAGGAEEIAPSDAALESVILGLRLGRGVPTRWTSRPPLEAAASWGMENGLLEPTHGERVRLTTRGRLLSNELFGRLA
jgi:oxygen-independent coproporphyrinogen-3 oxidase